MNSGRSTCSPGLAAAGGPAGHPVRLRTSYPRTGGVRHMIAALDLATGQICYRIRARKRLRELLAFFKPIRQHRTQT